MFSDTLEELKTDILIEIYQQTQEMIIQQIEKSPNLSNRKERENLLSQIKSILEDLYNPTKKFLDEGIETQKSIGIDSVNLDTNFSLIDKRAIEQITKNFSEIEDLAYDEVKSLLSYSYEQIRTLFNRSLSEYRTELLTKIASGQAQGFGAKKLQKIILDKLEEKGLTTISNRDLKKEVKATVQHTLINSRMSGVVQRALERGYDLVKVSTHRNPSPMCSPYQGEIVSITGQTKGYKTLNQILFKGDFGAGGGILHRYCRHSLTVYIG
jgi:hypothetical protein